MQTNSAFRRAPRGHARSHVSRLSSAAAGLRLQGLLPGDDLGRDVPERLKNIDIVKKSQQNTPAPDGSEKPPVRVVRLTETSLMVADPGENILARKVVSREGKVCGIVKDMVIALESQQALFIEVLLTGQASPTPVSVLVPVEAIRQITAGHVYIEQSHDRVRHAPACNLAEAFETWRHHLYGHFGYPCFPLNQHSEGDQRFCSDVPYWSAGSRFSPHLCPPDDHHY